LPLVIELLLQGVILDEIVANNGGVLINSGLLITILVTVRHEWYNLLEDQKIIKIIPWEVDLILI
jgi:hypothetical protein